MKEKIKEVQNYFADKIARGLYKITEIRKHTMDVQVDQKFTFCLWVGNGLDYIETYDGYKNFMQLHFTTKQKAQIAKRIKSLLDKEAKEREVSLLKSLLKKHPDAVN